MRLSTAIITAIAAIVLIVLLIGIIATFPTFIHAFTQFELIGGYWGRIFLIVLLASASFVVCAGCLLGVWFGITEIQIRRLRLVRYAPTPEGYYEALQTEDGFVKPEDNPVLQVPHTFSPHITNPKPELIEPQSDEATVIELYEKGLTLRSIAESTNRTYYQVQKITSAWKSNHG